MDCVWWSDALAVEGGRVEEELGECQYWCGLSDSSRRAIDRRRPMASSSNLLEPRDKPSCRDGCGDATHKGGGVVAPMYDRLRRRFHVPSRLGCRSSESLAYRRHRLQHRWHQRASGAIVQAVVPRSCVFDIHSVSTSSTPTHKQAMNEPYHRVSPREEWPRQRTAALAPHCQRPLQPAAQPQTLRAATDDSTAQHSTTECNRASTTTKQMERSRPYRSGSSSDIPRRTEAGCGSDGEAKDGRSAAGDGRM